VCHGRSHGGDMGDGSFLPWPYFLIFFFLGKISLKEICKNITNIVNLHFFFNILGKKKNSNRLKLTPIIECILLCGRREIALRGHRDFGSIHFEG
jgi:hypothetical protein